MDKNWQADLQRVGGSAKAFFREQSLWAIWVYRFGQRANQRPNGFIKKIHTKCYWVLHRLVETITGIGLPKDAHIGPGLRIWHFGGIFVNPKVTMGEHCTLRQGVTLGDKGDGGDAPHLGDHVDIGAYAQIIGPIKIGSHVKIGAMAVVVRDVPDYATVVGNPARIILKTTTPQADSNAPTR